jgi:ATP-binding cassette subfamily B protein
MSTSTKPLQTQGPAAPSFKHLLSLMPYLRRYLGRIFLGMLALAGMGVFGSLGPLVIGVITDSLAGKPVPFANDAAGHSAIAHSWLARYTPHYAPLSRETLLIYCFVLVGLIALKGIFSFYARWILIGISRDTEYDLRNDLLSRLLLLEPEFYVRNRTGELMSRCTNDLNAVRMVLGPGIMYSATTIVSMVLAIALMLRLSPSLTLWILLPVPVVAVAVRHFGKVIHELYEEIQAALATLSARVQENLSGVRVVRSYAQEDAEIRAFDAPNREYVARNMRLIRTWSMFMPSLTALIGTTFLIILWQGGHQVLQGKLSVGALISFNAFLVQLVWPMIALGWVTNIFQRGAASMGRLNYILQAEPRIDDRLACVSGRGIRGEIEFRHLTFAYPTSSSALHGNGNGNGDANRASRPVLEDVTLRIPAGSSLAVVGPTGSGKSTLAALVARLWEAPYGSLLLDGLPLPEWPLEQLRRSIGFVPQDTYLFGDTISGNIAFGLPSADEDLVRRAAGVSSLDADVEQFPHAYDTLVGERGITLSGGQKQRTALARAVIRDPRILILDDALSSVDTDTEERILTRLRSIMRDRTTILVSHRCSTVRHADQIAVLHEGRIVEHGTHDELLVLGGYYADLYQKQLLEEELERA